MYRTSEVYKSITRVKAFCDKIILIPLIKQIESLQQKFAKR